MTHTDHPVVDGAARRAVVRRKPEHAVLSMHDPLVTHKDPRPERRRRNWLKQG